MAPKWYSMRSVTASTKSYLKMKQNSTLPLSKSNSKVVRNRKPPLPKLKKLRESPPKRKLQDLRLKDQSKSIRSKKLRGARPKDLQPRR